MNKTIRNGWLGAIALAAFFLLPGIREAAALTCEVTPDHVNIDLFYHGAKLVVHGTSAPGQELLVKISSPSEDLALKYKGKASGLFWMKMGNMEFKNVPNTYLLYTSREIERLLPLGEQIRYNVGYPAMKAQTAVESATMQVDKERWFAELLRFKQKDNLYHVQEGVITRKHGPEGDDYRLEIPWPYQAPPGTYTVEVMAVQDGAVTDTATASLRVDQAGMVKQLSYLAFERSAVYGVMAVVIALMAGFAVGALFKKGGGAH